jgi:rod shape-determining protein MreD
VPDVLLIFVVYLGIREGQAFATVAGFIIGLTMDIAAGEGGMLGLAALCKTIGGFTAGYFYNENRMAQILGGYQFLIAVGITALVHNTLYFLIFLQGSGIPASEAFFLHAVPGALYAVILALLPMFVFARKSSG